MVHNLTPDQIELLDMLQEEAAEEAIRGLLKVCPEKQYAYGFINMMAKVEAPPVKFTKL